MEHRCGWERNGANRQKKEFLETAAAAIPKLVDLIVALRPPGAIALVSTLPNAKRLWK